MDWNAGERGYELRDWESYPEYCAYPQYTGKIYPRKDWVELIELQKKNMTSPLHVHKYNKVPVLNQGKYGYCWMYGTVACILNRYAAQGIDPVPNLNAHATAAMGKGYRNQGGFGIEATKYVEKYGIPTFDVWPEFSNFKPLQQEKKVKQSCAKHKIVTFEETPRNSFDEVMSALIDPIDPSPCTLAFNWWRHLVGGLRGKYRGTGRNIEWGLSFVNSWKESWGSKGYGTVWNDKAKPFEAIVVRSVKAVKEN